MISCGVKIPPSIRQQAKLSSQKSACFTPQTEPRSFKKNSLCFQKIYLKKRFLISPQKWAQLLEIKKARSMPNKIIYTKTFNAFKIMYLRGVLAGSFGGELELKGNNFTNSSKNCFSLQFRRKWNYKIQQNKKNRGFQLFTLIYL